MVYLFGSYSKMMTYTCCCQHVIDIVTANKVRVNMMPFSCRLSVAETEAGSTAVDMPFNDRMQFGIRAISYLLQVLSHTCQMGIVQVDEYLAVGTGAQEII